MFPRRRHKKCTRDGEDNQECVVVDRRRFRSVALRDTTTLLLRSLRRCCSFRLVWGCGVEDIVLCVESTPTRFHFDFEKRDQSSRRFVLTSSPLSLSLSNDAKKNSMLHRRRVRRRPDNGHDRAEVPTHRGRERLVVFTRFIIIIIIIHFSSCWIRFQRWCSKHRACGALRAPFSTPPRTRPRKERDERFSSSHPRVQNDDEAWWSFVEWVALSLSFARM